MTISPHTLALLQARVSGAPVGKKRNKYNARKVELDGYTFDSIAEGERYKELRLLVHAGTIWDLEPHPTFLFVVNGLTIGSYTADFAYVEGDSRLTIEDVKSTFTRKNREYRRNLKLMKAIHGVTVKEVVKP